MLALKNIVKDYIAGGQTVRALKGVSINFRQNEFVSILGPSGCGKTTLLNIMGGLDHYTSGDLVINGVSTKQYKDRDWDVYRNHRIGFIFQSYNLIPHQTVLGNVELALTIAGLSKEERIAKAKQALDRVGLKNQYNKKPNQLSGGQCQRVAIARALVNNPEILLADEPTGALDTATSVQIMDLIKEISSERLVIMVTHNPELANQYSSRIVRLLDGEIIEDSNPFTDEDEKTEVELIKSQRDALETDALKETSGNTGKAKTKRKKEKAKMSIFTAFMLSAKNLISKKGRTVMVGIAGSIGIIGIALVLAFSAGIKGYVASMQDDMLSGNPITITEQTYDLDGLMGMMDNNQKQELVKQPNKVAVDSMIEYFISRGKNIDSLLIKNDLTSNYVNYVKEMPSDYYAAMKLSYGIDIHNNVYTKVRESGKTEDTEISITALTSVYTEILKKSSFEEYAKYVSMFIPDMQQAPNNVEYIRSQYQVYGKIAENKNEVMLVINSDEEMSDLLLARLGYYTQDEFLNLIYRADENDRHNPALDKDYFDYSELTGKKFYWYPNDKVFGASSNPLAPYTYNSVADSSWKTDADALELEVVGILKPNESVMFGSLTSGIYYTEALTDYILEKNDVDDGILNYYKNLDVSSYTTPQQIAMIGTTPYELSYYFDDDNDGVFDLNVSSQYVSLSGTASLMSMFGGSQSTVSAKDVKDAVIRTLGGNKIANSITIYPNTFDSKDLVTGYLDCWNGNADVIVNGVTITDADRTDVKYTDTLSLVINLINTMIDVVSYALIAFTSVSLVVSTVMIGIITYVSVVERIKEIGVIRSLGGRKKDVSRLFNAETFIIGLLAGIIGILVTLLISAIINAVLYPIIGIKEIAALPLVDSLLLILLSVALTSISGLIPAKSAANKDPVIALRTE